MIAFSIARARRILLIAFPLPVTRGRRSSGSTPSERR